MAWKLANMLWTYRECNPTVRFSKYKFNNKLLDGVTFFRVILGLTWIVWCTVLQVKQKLKA